MPKKAAVVIGVDKPGNYAPLKSAATGAKEVADWLKKEGYDVECLTDENGPVTAQDARKAIAQYVTEPPRYHMLVVYFAGHGEYHTRADHWLFSNAPTQTDDAINLEGAMALAKYSGIENVVFISDACRSLPDTRAGAFVKGIDAFPNFPNITKGSKIDYFKATCESQPAYEGSIDGELHGFLTYALRSAYIEPKSSMIHVILENGKQVEIVPNRRLETFLQAKINDIIATKPGVMFQRIDVNVPSADDVYISRVIGPIASGVSKPVPPTLGNIASAAINSSMFRDAAMSYDENMSDDRRRQLNAIINLQVDEKLTARLPDRGIDHYESQCGFTLRGASLVRAACTRGSRNARVEILGKSKDSTIIRLWDVDPAVTVAVEFDNGRCGILPALAGYIGHAYYEGEGLSNVSFVPSSNHWRYPMYEHRKENIDYLRAVVSIAMTENTFRIGSEREALDMADRIRIDKAIDPTLGLYAAHAYSQAGNDKLVFDVLRYMREDLNADLFDVKLLASRLKKSHDNILTVPFCPILTQSWNLLRPFGTSLPSVLEEAMPYLCNSLWTTFQPKVTEQIFKSIKNGELK